jgi:hypothetical protein
MKNFLNIIMARFRRYRQGPQYEVWWNEREVHVQWQNPENKSKLVSFQWDSVLAVETFKRDLLTVDCICLAFQTNQGWIEINEDMKGWENLLDAVKDKLPGFPSREKWWDKVMLPPFATNHLKLWNQRTAKQVVGTDGHDIDFLSLNQSDNYIHFPYAFK